MDLVADLSESTALPRIDPTTRLAVNRLFHHQAPSIAIAIRGEPHRFAWTWRDAPLPPHDIYRFRLGGRNGRLALDAPTQAALFGERRFDRLPIELRYLLLADALHDTAEALMRDLQMAFEWCPDEVRADERDVQLDPYETANLATFAVTSTTDATRCWRGAVALDDAALFARIAPPLDASRSASLASFMRIRFRLRFEIGTTRVRLHEIRGVAPGDIVSIDEWRCAGAAVVVTTRLGGPAGRQWIALAEGSRITIQQSKEDAMNRVTDPALQTGEGDDAENLPMDRLDALEVTLRFEVGDLSLSLGELRNLRAGYVFELGQPLNRSPVRILAHGNLLGKGHLVAVGDRLGVRISEFAPNQV